VNKLSINTVFPNWVAICIAILCITVPAHSQVYVGGELTGNETYSPGNNPYIVTQDLIITQDVTLTVLPGVEMWFEYGTSLIINGVLVAKGSADQKIKLLPKSQIPNAGQWNGLVFNNAKSLLDSDSLYVSGSILSDVDISSASYSVTLDHGTTLLIEKSEISKCSFGIYINESGNNTIRNCDFKNCDFGLFFARGYPNAQNKIYRNSFSECSDVGIFINSTSLQSNHNYIQDNRIMSCSIGLHIGNFSNNGAAYNMISGNSFTGNKDAIKLFQQSNTIQGNYFIRNRSGIICWQSAHNTITQNLFSRNILNAITLASGSSFNNVSYNSMNYNSGGVWIKPDSLRNSVYNSFLYNTVYENTDFSFQLLNTPQGPIQFNNIGRNGNYQSFKNIADSIVHAEYNYWGTASENGIDSIIYDLYDLPLHGEVLYKPILNTILSIAPVPPPAQVIKQRIGTDMVVSWARDSITDLTGYYVYSGKNDGIVYEHKSYNGMNTKFNMGNIPVDDTIAITAIDSQANGISDLTEGHESDFAYAILVPFAGPDTAICFNSEYTINTATAFNYESISWSTSGDGEFNNIHSLSPVYTPGPDDFLNGYVYLYLDAESIENRYKDEALVTFHDAPEVFAGNDTIIIVDSTLWLNGATASGYSFLKWTTSGDGTFSSDSICNPEYRPGPGDLSAGEVTLSITAFSACGSATDPVKIVIDPGYTIEGRIHAGNVLAPYSNIKIFQLNDDIVQPIRTGLISTDGVFKIQSLLGGTYFLYAVPDKTKSPGYMPTYFYDNIHWGNAHKIELSENTYDVDIDLVATIKSFQSGEGSLFGFCTSTSGSSGNCGEVTVILYDKQMKNVLDWVLVQNGSDFRFKNLPFGEYVLSGEIAGGQFINSGVIVLSPSQPKIEDIELECTPAGYKFSVPDNPDPGMVDGNVKIFPNPVTDMLYISGLTENANYSINLINSQARVEKYFTKVEQNNINALNLNALPSGFYIIEICIDGKCVHRQKMIKN
jgi:parallel beta-helix repeat protein